MSDFELTSSQLQTISDAIQDRCDADFSLSDDLGIFRTYSGRGMFGRECIGLTLSGMGEAWEIAMTFSEGLLNADVDSEVIEAFKSPSQDSMGRGIILYWPSISLEADEDEDAEEQPYPGTPAFERA